MAYDLEAATVAERVIINKTLAQKQREVAVAKAGEAFPQAGGVLVFIQAGVAQALRRKRSMITIVAGY